MTCSSVAWLRRRMTAQGNDAGVVLIFVMLTMVMVTMFVTAGLAYALQSQEKSRGNQDYNAALAAAQAGVDDFISNLNRSDDYLQLSPFGDCANLAIKGAKAPMPNSCGWDASTPAGWKPVDAAKPTGAQFHYDVDPSTLFTNGSIDLKSTGRVNGESRTLQVAVARRGSTDFLYYSDHEDANPSYYAAGMSPDCYSYWYGPAPDAPATARTPRSGYSTASGCLEIRFVGGDVLDGPVHTNDTPWFEAVGGVKPEFKQGLQTAEPKCDTANAGDATTWGACDRTALSANYGTAPKYSPPLYLPNNSSEFDSYPGCHYLGETRVIFNDNGTMTVWSKNSTTLADACGGPSPMGVTRPVPNGQVIYVKADGGPVGECSSKEIDGTLPLGTRDGTNTQLSGYEYDTNMAKPHLHCGLGNVYVQGTLKGRVTVAAQGTVVVTGDIRLQGGVNGPDMMGLVAGNSVEVFHPVVGSWSCNPGNGSAKNTCTSYTYLGDTTRKEVAGWPVRIGTTDKGIAINASVQSLQGSYLVQSHGFGAYQGTMVVRGSLAQKWRGVVSSGSPPAAGSTGYLKDYRYDTRLKYSAPPYFPSFINSQWSPRATGEIAAQY
jgi:Tfp pilus assembly protein PilX